MSQPWATADRITPPRSELLSRILLITTYFTHLHITHYILDNTAVCNEGRAIPPVYSNWRSPSCFKTNCKLSPVLKSLIDQYIMRFFVRERAVPVSKNSAAGAALPLANLSHNSKIYGLWCGVLYRGCDGRQRNIRSCHPSSSPILQTAPHFL